MSSSPHPQGYAPSPNPYAGASAPPHQPPPCAGQPYRILQHQGPVMRYLGNAPYPPPPLSNKTPEQLWQELQAQEAQQRAMRDQQFHARQQHDEMQGKRRGLFGQLQAGLQSAGHHLESFAKDVSSGATRAMRDSEQGNMQRKFAAVFPSLPGPALAGYNCSFLSGSGQLVPGTVFVAPQHMAFAPFAMSQHQPPFFEPLSNVLSHQYVNSQGGAGVQIFTRTSLVYQFERFDKSVLREMSAANLQTEKCQTVAFSVYIDHQWRRCSRVPEPGYAYSARVA